MITTTLQKESTLEGPQDFNANSKKQSSSPAIFLSISSSKSGKVGGNSRICMEGWVTGIQKRVLRLFFVFLCGSRMRTCFCHLFTATKEGSKDWHLIPDYSSTQEEISDLPSVHLNGGRVGSEDKWLGQLRRPQRNNLRSCKFRVVRLRDFHGVDNRDERGPSQTVMCSTKPGQSGFFPPVRSMWLNTELVKTAEEVTLNIKIEEFLQDLMREPVHECTRGWFIGSRKYSASESVTQALRQDHSLNTCPQKTK